MILPKDLPWAITMLVSMFICIFMVGKIMLYSNIEYGWVYSLLLFLLAIVFILLIKYPLL